MSLSLEAHFAFKEDNSMQVALVKIPERKPIERLSVVRNFREAMEARDISLINSELYQFLTLHCGFIAHYDINGFKGTYSSPKDFAGVFIRHFERGHSYFSDIYRCDEGPYKGTGYTKAEIKQEFHRIVDMHIDSITRWAESEQRQERLDVYRMIKEEFEGKLKGITVECEGCHASYEVKVLREGNGKIDIGSLHCFFCSGDISL
jgi:hypothetical protein